MASSEPDLEKEDTTTKVSTFDLTRTPARAGAAMESRTMSIRSIRETVSPSAARIPVEFRTLSLHVDSPESKTNEVKGKRPKGAAKGLSHSSAVSSDHVP